LICWAPYLTKAYEIPAISADSIISRLKCFVIDFSKALASNSFQLPRLFISDPLYLAKRGRYPLINNQLFSFFMQNNSEVNVNNLVLLIKENAYSESAFLLPFCLLLSGISADGITVRERACLLIIVEGYLNAYLRKMESFSKWQLKKLFPSSGTFLFAYQLVRDIISCVFPMMKILIDHDATIGLSRLETSSIEYLFATFRFMSYNDDS
jgi:hypothetical protein